VKTFARGCYWVDRNYAAVSRL